jgi:ribosomal protein L37AE/L43A
MGDRECPNCGEESLIEKTLTIWVCMNPNCKEEYNVEDLDRDVEWEDQ